MEIIKPVAASLIEFCPQQFKKRWNVALSNAAMTAIHFKTRKFIWLQEFVTILY